MEILKIPTDSLYKFFAITGIIIVVVSVVPMAWLNYVFNTKVINLETEMDMLNQSIIVHNRRSIEKPCKTDAEIEISQQDYLKYKLEEARIKGKQKEIAYIVESGKKMTILSILLAACGVLLASTGFRLWYKNIQRYQDYILRAQATTPNTITGDSGSSNEEE